VFGRSDFTGAAIHECHSPETTETVKKYYKEYTEKKRELDYYVMDEPTGKITVVNVPFYEGEVFNGVVEFIFESSLS
jgi:GH18 family chitinase